jgi:hypothetical protein
LNCPHATHVLLVGSQVLNPLHLSPGQHRWPTLPQDNSQRPLRQTLPSRQDPFAQQRSPTPPHATHCPLEQREKASQRAPVEQQGNPLDPQGRQRPIAPEMKQSCRIGCCEQSEARRHVSGGAQTVIPLLSGVVVHWGATGVWIGPAERVAVQHSALLPHRCPSAMQQRACEASLGEMQTAPGVQHGDAPLLCRTSVHESVARLMF